MLTQSAKNAATGLKKQINFFGVFVIQQCDFTVKLTHKLT